jgi:hypothetical protein
MGWQRLLEFLKDNGMLLLLLLMVVIGVIYGFAHPEGRESFEYRGQEAPESGN